MNLNPNASQFSFGIKPPVPGLNIFLYFISFPHLQSFVIPCSRALTPVGNNPFPQGAGLGNFNNQVNNGQANPGAGVAAVPGLNIFLCFISFPYLQSFVTTCSRTLTPIVNNPFPQGAGLGNFGNAPINAQANPGAGGAAVPGLNIFLCFISFPHLQSFVTTCSRTLTPAGNNPFPQGAATPVSGGAPGPGLNIFLCFISFPHFLVCNHSSFLAHVHSLL